MKILKVRKKIALVFSLLIFASVSLNSFAVGTTKILSVYAEKQKGDMWCWAATSQSVIDKIAGRRPTQAQIVYNIFGTSNGDEGASPSQDKESLKAWGVGSTMTPDDAPLDFNSVKININNGQPIKSQILIKNTGSGHVDLIYGYYEDGANQQVYYIDPGDLSYTATYYTDFKDNIHFKLLNQLYNCYKTY